MFKWKGTAGELIDLITKMTVRYGGGCSLFSPLRVDVQVKKKKMSWAWLTTERVAYTKGETTRGKLSGKSGEYIFEAEMAQWLTSLAKPDEKIIMIHDGTEIVFKGEEFEATYIPTDYDATRAEDAKKFKVKKWLPDIGIDWKKVEVEVSRIATILGKASLVYGKGDIRVLRLDFNVDKAIIGSLESHSKGISCTLKAKIEEAFNITLGQNFAEVISILEGEVEMYGSGPGYPLWIVSEDVRLKTAYLISQYAEEEEETSSGTPLESTESDGDDEEGEEDEEIEIGGD